MAKKKKTTGEAGASSSSSSNKGNPSKGVMTETLRIIKCGKYTSTSEEQVKLDRKIIQYSMSNSAMITNCAKRKFPNSPKSGKKSKASGNNFSTKLGTIDFSSNFTLDAAEKCLNENPQQKVAVLVFASDTNPGGGCHGNQKGTQEECIARRTTMVPSMETLNYPIPNEGAAFIPGVLVFRSNEVTGYQLLPKPFEVGCIATALRCVANGDRFESKQREFVLNKVLTILNIAVDHGYSSIILGCIGCGAFGNPVDEVGRCFDQVLNEYGYKHFFDQIVFAIPTAEKKRIFEKMIVK